MTKQEADFIGSMNMCDEISNEAYKKIMCNCEVEEQQPCEDCISRTEAINAFEKFIHELGIKDEPYNYGEMALSVQNVPSVKPQSLEQIKWERDTAIEQLKQLGYGLGEKVEPCEDCISREAVRRILANQRDELVKLHTVNPKDNPKADAMAYGVNWSLNTLMELPSVKPQRPKGKWIEQNDTSKHHFGWYYCSNCGAYLMSADGANYCSCCGAEMEDSND